MNMKVKVAIAGAIVIALVALIVVDQTSNPADQKTEKKEKGRADESIFRSARNRPRTETTNRETEIIFTNPEVNRTSPETVVEPETPVQPENPRMEVTIKGENGTGDNPDGTRIKAVDIIGMEFEEYEIRPGDTLSSIAARKYGDQNLWKVISNANPGIRATALRVGKKIRIPSRPTLPTSDRVIETIAGRRTYTVQPGDTLGGISKKIYNTVRHADRIFEENRDLLESPDQLQTGTKLRLPEIQAESPLPVEVPLEIENEELLGNMMHKVKSNDSLWKIAESYRSGRNILRVIEEIVRANPRKLLNDHTPLKVGWRLVIPN